MKITYRQATEMKGAPGAMARGTILNRIVTEFYSQPEVKTGMLLALLLGAIYALVVAVIMLTLNLGAVEFSFGLVGLIAAVWLAAFSAPTKGYLVFVSEHMDKEYEL